MIPSSSQRSRSSALDRLGLAAEGADASLSPAIVAAALGGGLSNPLVSAMPLQQLGLRGSILSHDVGHRSPNTDILSTLVRQDALREALAVPTRTLANPLDSIAAAAAAPRLSLVESLQQDAIVSEAFQRGKEEAILSLLRSGAVDASILQKPKPPPRPPVVAAASAPPARPVMDAVAHLPGSKDTNTVALEALGTTGIERRKKNAPYFDASSLADPDPVTLANRRTRGGVTEPFPEKLHRMLRETEANGESEIVSFFGHGRAFAIHHVERFCREVMPRYFKQSRLSSFQRQLNLYGFNRITSGPDTGGYYHELFLKGRPALVIHMRRVGVPKPSGNPRAVRPTNTSSAPDFYSMAPVKGMEGENESGRT